MSDFIFSNVNIKKGILTKKIKKIYKQEEIKEFHGPWGSLAITINSLNTNFLHFNEDYIMAALGNPTTLKDLNEKTPLFLFDNYTDWSEIINGPFLVLVINKQSNEVHILTDLMSFIPIFKYKYNDKIFISSHVDLLAKVTGETKNRDKISEVDFILNGIVTYPYTSYRNIKQLAPGTEINILSDGTIKDHQYWAPHENKEPLNLEEAAVTLSQIIKKDIAESISNTKNIAHFLSGGEDSRVVTALLKDVEKDGFLFLDDFNREGKIASKIADIYNSNLTIKYRKPSYYIDILESASRLVGKGVEYIHAHSIGFAEECNLSNYELVFGGLFSDAFLKGSRIKTKAISQKLPFLPDKKSANQEIDIINNKFFDEKILKELNDRRKKHFLAIKKLRQKSALEWFALYPSNMNNNSGNYHVSRRLFNSYEPFLSNDIIKLSAAVSQESKLNRKLFNLAFKEYLEPSKSIMHGKGFLPYYPWYVNGWIQFVIKIYRKILNAIFYSNEGPWADWNQLMQTKQWEQQVKQSIERANKESSYYDYSVEKLLKTNAIDFFQKLNLMEIIYLNGLY